MLEIEKKMIFAFYVNFCYTVINRDICCPNTGTGGLYEMYKKNGKRQLRLVVGLEDASDLDFVLELLADLEIWAPHHITKKEIFDIYGVQLPFPKNVSYQKLLLISSYEKAKLLHFISELHQFEINAYASPIF